MRCMAISVDSVPPFPPSDDVPADIMTCKSGRRCGPILRKCEREEGAVDSACRFGGRVVGSHLSP